MPDNLTIILPKATLDVALNPVYPGETVTLTCSVESGSNWIFKWYKDSNDTSVIQSNRHNITGSTLTISSVDESDQGLYWCHGERGDTPTSSSISEPVRLTVKALPKATLTVDLNPVYPGETVTLTCSVESGINWIYKWNKDSNDKEVIQSNRHTITGSTLTIRRVEGSDQGLYWCHGEKGDRPTSTSISNSVTVTVKAQPKATLTVDLNPVYPGETVTLTCSVESDIYWIYKWYKGKNNKAVIQSNSLTITGSTLTISTVVESDQGLYRCHGERRDTPTSSSISEPVDVTVKALPVATLTVSPNPVYAGEKVTLTCSVGSYSDWTGYEWYKVNSKNTVSKVDYSTGDTLTISSDTVGNYGYYKCRGKQGSRPEYSDFSEHVNIYINALPTATLTVSPDPIYTGEKVTLKCSVGSYSDWTGYEWYKVNSMNTVSKFDYSPGDTFTISSDTVGYYGYYKCRGIRGSRPEYSSFSEHLRIYVKGIQPKATLSSDTQEVLTGDRVTLSCRVESSGWMFYWYRDRLDSTPVTTTDGSSYTLSPVRVSDGGQYWCRAGRGEPPYYTLYSDPVRINVTERPVAVLTLLPNWTQIFTGETVTLRCVILGGEDTGWEYRWNRNNYELYYVKEPEYRISPADTSHSGSYICQGVKGSRFSTTSEAVQLTVSNGPRPVLSVSPQWLNPGDSVTLRCEVKESTGWRFFWYRVVPSDESYTNEPLSGYGTTEDSYPLNPAGYINTGGYVCRAGRGDPVYYTDYSEPQFLWSGDQQPAVSLTVNPNRTQHFTRTSVSLSCENKDNSTGWNLMRYTEKRLESSCSSNWATTVGSICTFKNTKTWYSGVYWCEFGSGQYSNAVNLTVTDADVILESPAHPVTEGDEVTLVCKHKTTRSNITAAFYKDGIFIKNETTGEMSIPAISKSDEGFYKCKYKQRESPESWVTVRVVAPGSSLPVLIHVAVGLVVAVVLLVFILVLLCRCKKAKGSCSNNISLPPKPQTAIHDPQPDGLQTGGANIYAMISPSDNDNDAAGASTASGPGDGTYVVVQLKKLDNKKKGKRVCPTENIIYSEVNTGKLTASGPVDVTYAEIDLKKKPKAKKKTARSGPTDTTEKHPVYSLLKH
ncbi:hypothetical protein UPYG_G00159750 [Umbra pygmaea]|uniref:Ig-like domain-containing protein n=1 Tax=Umbra pygmaea TaxID=75934 RepID=A0ABD0WYZ4_UMBPY